jgi:hypothetical protein
VNGRRRARAKNLLLELLMEGDADIQGSYVDRGGVGSGRTLINPRASSV